MNMKTSNLWNSVKVVVSLRFKSIQPTFRNKENIKQPNTVSKANRKKRK